MAEQHGRATWVTTGIAAVAVIAGIAGLWQITPHSERGTIPDELLPVTGRPGQSGAKSESEADTDELWAQIVNRPDGPPRIATGMTDQLGRAVSVSCTSCHANLEPNPRTRAAEQLTDFHHGLAYDHGDLTCLSCHNADDYNTLRLAGGDAIGYTNVQNLCAQCHAPQANDFARGAHGGMLGYWDRSRGRQTRKNCIDCHDPHKPAFPRMTPDFKPRDRFLEPAH